MDNKKITLSQLIQRASQRKEDRAEYKDIYISPLDGTLTFKRLPLSRVLDMIDSYGADVSTRDGVEFNCEIISASCEILRDQALREAYSASDPIDLVQKVFEENVGAINLAASEILEWYGLDDDAIKN